MVIKSESKWMILSKNAQLRSEDSNVASPLELDVLVHVEKEHKHEVVATAERMCHTCSNLYFCNVCG